VEPRLDLSLRILRAARELFFTRGFARTQLRTIASKAGTSESGVLRVYGSKSLLLRAVCESCWEEVNAELDRALKEKAARDDDPRSLLVEVMRTVRAREQGYDDFSVRPFPFA
jgi:AcrR family transcriptional regulator